MELFNRDYSAEIHCYPKRNKMWEINPNYTAEKNNLYKLNKDHKL